MKINLVEIQNIRGIVQTSFKPDTLTVISGANGTGKSSIVDSLKALVGGGHDPTLLRKGAESGRVTVVFDDGQSLTLTVTQQKTTRIVRDEKGRTISAPMSVINEMTNAVSFDPLSFLEAKPEEQLKLLLEALPIRITAQELKAAGIPVPQGMSLDGHGLVVLTALHKAFYDERRGLSREAKSKQATIDELSVGLPEPNAEIEVALGVALIGLEQLVGDRGAMVKAIDEQEREDKQSVNTEFGKIETKVTTRLQNQIDELRQAATAEIDSARLIRDRGMSIVSERARTERASTETEFGGQIEAKREAVGVLRAQVKQSQQAEGQRTAIAKMKKDASDLETEIEGLNASLVAVANLRKTVTDKLPIPGLEIVDGRLAIDGIPLSTVNSADKILGVALQVALLRMKSLPFLVIDNGERLDSAHLGTLKRIASEKGLQVVLSRVTDDSGLVIQTEDQETC